MDLKASLASVYDDRSSLVDEELKSKTLLGVGSYPGL